MLALKDLAEVQDVRAVRRRPGSASLQLASPMATSSSLQLEPNATHPSIGLGPNISRQRIFFVGCLKVASL